MVATFPRLADAGRKGSSAMEAETCLKSRDRLKVPSTGRVFFFGDTRNLEHRPLLLSSLLLETKRKSRLRNQKA